MSPIPAINPTVSGLMPNVDLLPPAATPLPATGIEMPSELGLAQGVTSAQPADSFASMLGNMVSDVNAQQNISAQAVSALQSGQTVPLHQAVIAMEEANVSFQLMVEVRNRLLDSYQEIMRMQI
ncbi:MAG TPA: flagellar hook-basal body complex protein FliE [Verrucomicrobiae bacterium]|nr:flagellar hook-basal body complex protein FliE [Verrucomicrobiae bacterium]